MWSSTETWRQSRERDREERQRAAVSDCDEQQNARVKLMNSAISTWNHLVMTVDLVMLTESV